MTPALAWFALGFSVGILATFTVALVARPRRRYEDVQCPRCDPERAILDVHPDGTWICLSCGFEWFDPDLPRLPRADRDVQ